MCIRLLFITRHSLIIPSSWILSLFVFKTSRNSSTWFHSEALSPTDFSMPHTFTMPHTIPEIEVQHSWGWLSPECCLIDGEVTRVLSKEAKSKIKKCYCRVRAHKHVAECSGRGHRTVCTSQLSPSTPGALTQAIRLGMGAST